MMIETCLILKHSLILYGGTHDATVIVLGNGYGHQSSNLDKVFYISFSVKTFGKGMHLTILSCD